jgi:hypothetical protein
VITPKSKVQKIKKPATARPGIRDDTFQHPQKLVKRTAAVQFDVTSSPGRVATKPVKTPIQRPPQSTPPDLASLSTKKITFKKLLKGDDMKISCTVDIGGQTYVVKGGVGNAYIEDHVAHSAMFHKLNIPGVAAPGVVKLSNDFLRVLDAELEEAAAENPKVGLLRTALKQNQQMATAVPGLTVEDILANHTTSRQLVDKVRGKSDREALSILLGDLVVPPGKNKEATIAMIDDRKVNPQNLTIADLEALQVNLVSIKNQTILSLATDVRQIGLAGAVKDHDTRHTNLDRARLELISRIKSKEGASALGAMCAVDLLCGMRDRILGDFNGGNFMFDPDKKEFWCVDNAKTEFGLTGLVDVNLPDVNVAWRNWIVKNKILEADDTTANVTDRMHVLLFHTNRKDGDFFNTIKFAGDEENLVKEGVASGVKTALDRLRALADDDRDLTPAVRKNLKERLAFVEQKEAFTRACTFDPQFADIPAATKAKVLDKGVRGFQKRTKLEDQAKLLKDDARSGKLSVEDLLKREHALLEAQHLAGITDAKRDRRLDKALFESKLARLLLDLDAKKDDLLKLQGPLVAGTTVQKTAFTNAIKPWEDELRTLGDNKAVTKLQTARLQLEKAMDSLVLV